MNPFEPIFAFGKELITRLFPSPEDKAKRDLAEAELLKMQVDGSCKEIEAKLSAIVAEAKSEDKWTSRARPAFLYVIYIMILFSIPMGFLSAYNAEVANHISLGMKDWLAAIPTPLYELFGAGYLGYTFTRTWDKKEILQSKK